MIDYQEKEGAIVISFNRAPANAYTLEFHEKLNEALKCAESSSASNAVIIDSQIEKFFCAGADIRSFQENSVETNKRMVVQARENLHFINQSSKIYICAIAGHCLGGGLEIALACDFRFAAQKTFLMGLPEIKLGLIPGNGGSQRLTKLVGITHALELLISGEPITPERAFTIGLVNQLLPENKLHEHCLKFAQKLSKGAGLALAATKQAVYEGAISPLEEALKIEARWVDQLYDTYDAKEGFLAAIQKRDPEFKGE